LIQKSTKQTEGKIMTPNRNITPNERLEKLQQVAKLVQEANNILAEIRPGERMGDIAYFHNELSEFLSSDHGECGFTRFLQQTEGKLSNHVPSNAA